MFHKVLVFVAGAMLASQMSLADSQPYLNDVDENYSRNGPMNIHDYPRIILSETKNFKGTAEQFSKYHIVSGQTGSKKKIADIQNVDPSVMYFWHVSPRAYQGYNTPYCSIAGGLAFESSGPTTQGGPEQRGCSIFAGHWLYKAGSRLTNSVDASGSSVTVEDSSKFKSGNYVVIYNPPTGSFNNAEHAKITAINSNTNTLTLKRGFKSNAVFHPQNSIVAQHVIGQGGHLENWSYNMSTQSPVDANGNTASQAMSQWFSANIYKDKKGDSISIRVDGIQFDADFYDELTSKKTDANNDLIVDSGISTSGDNWWGRGLQDFYRQMRARFPDKFIISGNRRARGFEHLSGTQMEAFPAFNRTKPIPTYKDINSQISKYSFNLHYSQGGPLHTHNLNKTPMQIYPKDSVPRPVDNSVFRLGLGLTLMDDGYYGHENSDQHPDPWFDEYAVDVNEGSPNYGHAVPSNPADESAIKANTGWLGQPLANRIRLYDDLKFDENRSLVVNGDFNTNIDNWSGKSVNVNHDTTTSIEGAGSLHVSEMTSYTHLLSRVRVKGPRPVLQKGKEYTLAFSAKSTMVREFTAAVGTSINRFMVSDRWRRFVYTFTASSNGEALLWFGVGREKAQMWFDSVHLFEGNANLFRRDFENGIAIVNATPSARTIDLEETYQRINGMQDPINDGSTVNTVTINPWDAAILVRHKKVDVSFSPCGRPQHDPSTESAVVIWKDCDGSGNWYLRALAGLAVKGLKYTGTINVDTPGEVFRSVEHFDIETNHDTVNVSADNTSIDLSIKIWSGFVDGLNFNIQDNTTICFNIAPSGTFIIGENRHIESGNFCLE